MVFLQLRSASFLGEVLMPSYKLLALAITFLLAIPARSFAQDSASEIVGAWRVVSVDTRTADGKTSPLYGESVGGLIVYDASGKMSGHLMNVAISRCGMMDRRKCPDKMAREAFDNYLGYWGQYELLSGESAVVHHVEGASHPDWIGTAQKRYFRISGDTIEIASPPAMLRGVESVVVVTAQRVRAP
jgi:Lipocalin-like domain